MDYEAALAWLSRLEGSDVGVLIGSPNRDELPQAVLHGRLERETIPSAWSRNPVMRLIAN